MPTTMAAVPRTLLSCPFCGGTCIFTEPDERGSGGQWVTPIHVGCNDCKAEQMADTVDEAVERWNRRSAAPGVSTVEDAGFPSGAIVNGRVLADRLEAYPFESQGGDLRLCSDWVEFRRCFEYLAEWVGSRAPAAGDALDAARYRWICDKFGITKLPCAIERIIEGSYVADGKEAIDAAIDAAIAAQRKGDA